MRKESQGELFEELTRPETRKRARKTPPVARGYNISLNISYEQIVFIVIALIMAAVLIFSLGVEKGKNAPLAGPAEEVQPAEPEAIVEAMGPEEETALPAEAAEETQPEPVEPEPIKKVSRPYTIQVATYWSKVNAKKELENLKRREWDSLIIENDGRYEVCVGSYINKDDAAADMERLKKHYKDRFLRRR